MKKLGQDLVYQVGRFGPVRGNGSVAAVQWVLSGLFDRFPKLKIFFAENQIGWIPFFLQGADVRYDRHYRWAQRLLGFKLLSCPPSEYIRAHCLWGFQFDRVGDEQRLTKKDAEVARHEKALQEREVTLQKAKESLDEEVAVKLQRERVGIAAEEAKKAKRALENDLDQRAKEITELQEILKQREMKLAEAQKAQAEVTRKQRELEDAKRELELTVAKRVQAELDAACDKAKKDAEEELKLKVLEKEQTIVSMQRQIEDLKRRAEQGSQQLQGEVQELEIESLLSSRFPRDMIQSVPKGEFGGDVLHRVMGPLGQPCGTILWESKRTKNWSDTWLPKLREDQRTAKAEIAVIISQALPKDVETFDLVDGVCVANPRVP